MHLETPAIICAVLPHSEHGAVVRALTPDDGLVAGYVRGGRGRRLRPVLQAGNIVQAEFRARVEEQLPALTVELVRSRAAIALDPLGAVALEWLGGLMASVLPERQPYPAVHAALDALLGAMEGAEALKWTAAFARFELLLLAELGFGLDLTACVATGESAATADLTHVSPKSGGAVSAIAAAPWQAKLLRLPAFLIGRGEADWVAVAEALRLTGHFIERDLLEGRARSLLTARARLRELVDRSAAR